MVRLSSGPYRGAVEWAKVEVSEVWVRGREGNGGEAVSLLAESKRRIRREYGNHFSSTR